jgi:hypothetical protein
MKIHVTHDREGRIRSLVMQAPDADGELQVFAEGDDLVTEVEAEVAGDPRDERALAEQLRRIAEDHRVEAGAQRGKGRLVKTR